MEHRDWSSVRYEQSRQEGEKIEQLMRSILKMFATGNLVYRNRTSHAASVSTKSDRLRRLRRGTALTEGAAIA
ncbi:MAG: hypothetical protein R3F62_21895 [Planctomycetota bacterium]